MRTSSTARLAGVTAVVLFLMSICCAPAGALHAQRQLSTADGRSPAFAVAVTAGLLNGEATETTFSGGGRVKRSELIWELDNVAVGGVTATGRLTRALELNAGLWMPLSKGHGQLNDYDWIFPEPFSEWSHWSGSSVDVTGGLLFDLNLGWRFWETAPVTAALMAGIKRDHWQWEDFGGQYVYTAGNGFRNLTGTFPQRVGITYEQRLTIPYAGLHVDVVVGPLELGSYFFYSPVAWAEDEDHHLLRNLVFEREADHLDYLALGLSGALWLTPHLSLSLSLEHQNLMMGLGETRTRDTVSGQEVLYPGTAGIGHRNTALMFSLGYAF
jgi:plasminogen activator